MEVEVGDIVRVRPPANKDQYPVWVSAMEDLLDRDLVVRKVNWFSAWKLFCVESSPYNLNTDWVYLHKKGRTTIRKKTKRGKLLRRKAGKSHLLSGKTKKRKRALRKTAIVSKGYTKKLKRALPYS